MKKIITLLITIILNPLSSNCQLRADELSNFFSDVFKSIQNQDPSTYKSYLYTEDEIKAVSIIRSGRKIITPDQRKRLDDIGPEIHKEYLDDALVFFNKCYVRGKDININWPRVIFDSVTVDNSKTIGNAVYSGFIYFRDLEGLNFYIMNFEGLTQFNNSYKIEKVYPPFENPGPKNRILTATIKQAYINDCISLGKQVLEKDPKLENIFFGGSLQHYCDCEYYKKTEERDGVERIKKREFDFQVTKPNKKK